MKLGTEGGQNYRRWERGYMSVFEGGVEIEGRGDLKVEKSQSAWFLEDYGV